MRSVVVAILILGIALPASAQTRAQNYARHVKKQRAKAAAAAKAAQKKAEAAAKEEAKKRAADPAYAAAQEERERRQAAAGIVVLGALLGALAGAGSDSFESADATEDDVAERIRMRSQYYRDRAEREAAFGDYNAARSSLEMAK